MRFAADFRSAARRALAGRWGVALAVSLVAALLGGVGRSTDGFNITFNTSEISSFYQDGSFNLAALVAWLNLPLTNFSAAYASVAGTLGFIGLALFLIGGAVELGHNLFYIRLMRGEQASFGTLFSRFEIFLKALGLRLFMALFVFLWALLLVVPGIIASYRYRMAPYLMAEHPEMGIREAVEESKRMTLGYKGRWFCLDFSFIGWALLCVLTLGIGFLWLNPYQSAASAEFYLNILGERSGGTRSSGEDGPAFIYNGPERL